MGSRRHDYKHYVIYVMSNDRTMDVYPKHKQHVPRNKEAWFVEGKWHTTPRKKTNQQELDAIIERNYFEG